ncbi:MAG: PEP-CTERM sorting domain-containing protein [Sedimentisphaerales bacterium]|nr:PEP-CTERM sorting domain-containing protein [Sedimentisphaerales bacterium]
MKKRLFLMALSVGWLCGTVSAAISNDTPPAWRGDNNTTSQAWEFADSSNPAVEETGAPWDNPYGSPTASILQSGGGLVPPGDPDTKWMSAHPQFGSDQHFGVWRFYGNDYLELVIPNDPVERTTKEIYLQLTYSASAYPIFETTPGFAGIELVSDYALDSNYDILTLLITIEPNPDSETIELRPNDCTMYIDQIIVDTRCIPEPMSMVLLGLGAVALIRRRK